MYESEGMGQDLWEVFSKLAGTGKLERIILIEASTAKTLDLVVEETS